MTPEFDAPITKPLAGHLLHQLNLPSDFDDHHPQRDRGPAVGSGNRLNKARLRGASVLTVIVLMMTGCSPDNGELLRRPEASQTEVGGEEGGGKRDSSYAPPEEWSEPQRWAVLPRGEQVDEYDNEVGFPHTEQGAVAMLTAVQTTAAEGEHSLVDEQMSIFDSYMVRADRNEATEARVRQAAEQADADLRRDLGAPAEGTLPPGAYLRGVAVGFQVIDASAREVSAYVLSRVTTKASTTAEEDSAYSRTLLATEWEDDDWRLSSAASARAMQETQGQTPPEMVAPGDEAFNSAGWTAIREAS